FSIALLDGWAMVGDVLTFYQERIANEGYLRTATERRSIFELARLVGYAPRPGVASSTYLAFTMEKGFEGKIDGGVRAQSLPVPAPHPVSVLVATVATARLREAVTKLLAPPPAASLPPRNARAAPTDLADGFQTYSDAGIRLFGALHPAVADKVYSAYAGAVS